MRGKWLCAAAALLLSTNANAAKQYLDLRAAPEQESRMNAGVETVTSHLPQSKARITEPEERADKRVAVEVAVLNQSEQRFNFGPEDISVETADGQPVTVVAYDRLLREEKKRQGSRKLGAVLRAMGNSLAAADAGYSHGSFSAYGSGGAWAHGTYSSYDEGQAYAAQVLATHENRAIHREVQERNAIAMDALGVNLRTTTIDPGKAFGGQVVFELPPTLRKSKAPVDLVIRVNAGGETHAFHAQLVKR